MFEGYELAVYSLVALAFSLAIVFAKIYIDESDKGDKPA